MSMISRRKFLKYSGLVTAALGLGVTSPTELAQAATAAKKPAPAPEPPKAPEPQPDMSEFFAKACNTTVVEGRKASVYHPLNENENLIVGLLAEKGSAPTTTICFDPFKVGGSREPDGVKTWQGHLATTIVHDGKEYPYFVRFELLKAFALLPASGMEEKYTIALTTGRTGIPAIDKALGGVQSVRDPQRLKSEIGTAFAAANKVQKERRYGPMYPVVVPLSYDGVPPDDVAKNPRTLYTGVTYKTHAAYGITDIGMGKKPSNKVSFTFSHESLGDSAMSLVIENLQGQLKEEDIKDDVYRFLSDKKMSDGQTPVQDPTMMKHILTATTALINSDRTAAYYAAAHGGAVHPDIKESMDAAEKRLTDLFDRLYKGNRAVNAPSRPTQNTLLSFVGKWLKLGA